MSSTNKADLLRQLPSVDVLLAQSQDLIADYGRVSLLDVVRAELESTRQQILAEQDVDTRHAALLERISARLANAFLPTLRPVINATGVIIHTNLGRSPLSDDAIRAMQQAAASYSTLEFDMETGKRGSRLDHAAQLLTRLTGGEAALVVNNNAAATVLMLAGLAFERDVIVSRGQLVEIGGGFRVPDIMAQSGANLVEVGTTNRTRASDYAQAITDRTALLMRVHSSNFRLVGFTEEAGLAELAAVAGRHDVHLVDDLGSGALIDTAVYGLDHEPTPQESLAAGCDLVCFSGDKLLGGPQAGILVGRRTLIDQLKRHPLARAIRADKLCLAALSATLTHYLRGDAVEQIPVLRMIARPLDDIRAAAEEWAARFGPKAQVIPGESTVGGGSLPGATLPTMLVSLQPEQPDAFAAQLRHARTPVIARIAQDQVLLDPRTVLPGQEQVLLENVSAVLRGEVKL